MIVHGNAVSIPLADKSVHCVVTSPPYWGLRDYGVEPTIWGGDPGCRHEWDVFTHIPQPHGDDGTGGNLDGGRATQAQTRIGPVESAVCRRCGAWRGVLGLEPVHDCLAWARGEPPCNVCYVCHLRVIFGEIWRVLRDDGTVWLNLGDSYASSGTWGHHHLDELGACLGTGGGKKHSRMICRRAPTPPGLKKKDLVGIPWRVALALQADGWYLRSDIIWSKPNALPESVKDRPTRVHEYIFLLAKSRRYFYDWLAVREAPSPASLARINQASFHMQTGGPKDYGHEVNTNRSMRRTLENFARNPGRNKRSVWIIPTKPYVGAHFAVFPGRLIEPCISAGTSARGVCRRCGAPWERVTEPVGLIRQHWAPGTQRKIHEAQGMHGRTSVMNTGHTIKRVTTGWRPTCDCDAGEPVPAVVLDPFAGSGTVGEVCRRLGRRFVGIDLNLRYLRDLALPRAEQKATESALRDLPLFCQIGL